MTGLSPLGALIARAARAFGARWPLYLAVSAAAFGLQVAIEASHLLAPALLSTVGAIVVLPLAAAIAYGWTAADLRAGEEPAAEVWARIAERAWAVVVIDALSTLLILGSAVVPQSFGPSLLYFTGALILMALLVFADVHAVVEPGLSALSVLPASILASARIGLTREGYIRAILLVLTQVALTWASAFAPPLAATAFFSFVATPFAVLVATIYLDIRGDGR